MTMERLAEIESKDMKGKGISLQHNTTLKWQCNKGKQIQLGLLGEGGDIKGRSGTYPCPPLYLHGVVIIATLIHRTIIVPRA